MISGSCGETTERRPKESERQPLKVTGKRLVEMIERQQYRCALSGRKLTPKTASLDHIVPFSKGGEHTMENVQIVHVEVNNAKGTLTQEQFIAVCRDVCKSLGSYF